MAAFILFVENEVSTQAGAPTAAQIETTLRSLPVNGDREFKLHAGLPGDAGFVGNARITRIARVGIPGGRVTRVAWLYAWPDPPGATPEQNATLRESVIRNVLANTQTFLPREWVIDGVTQTTGWKPPVSVSYDPAVNGTLEWWQSPAGSYATATRDTFDLNQQLGRQSTIDNPIGPTTNRAPDFDPFGTNNPNGVANRLLDLATTVAWVVGGVAALVYVVGPLVGAVLSPKSRTNPDEHDDWKIYRYEGMPIRLQKLDDDTFMVVVQGEMVGNVVARRTKGPTVFIYEPSASSTSEGERVARSFVANAWPV